MIFKKRTTELDAKNLPLHIGIIMDGNGRWANKRGLPRKAGHAAGAENFKKIVTFCGEIGISYLTVYAFSAENWSRPHAEVDALMELFSEHLGYAGAELEGKNVRVRIIGDRDSLSDDLKKRVVALEEHTKDNDGLQLNIAISYGGRQEITVAARQCARMVKSGEITPMQITPKLISSMLYTAGQPDPDLIIRPSGERRLSNFLVWQSAYSELWFSSVLWPSFKEKHLIEAISDYQNRNRRYGGI